LLSIAIGYNHSPACSSCDIHYTEGIQSLNWPKIMKTIVDDTAAFFADGGWSFLEPDASGEDEEEKESDDDDDVYRPSDEDDEEEADSDASDESGSGSAATSEEDESGSGDEDEDADSSGKDWSDLEEEAKRGEYILDMSMKFEF
jgi:nucleosome binding factor SPN SPT16 subunit